MSKRKNKNKYRHSSQMPTSDMATDQQAELPLPRTPEVCTADCASNPHMNAQALAEPVPLEAMPDAAHAATTIVVEASLGQRLRAAREARGLSREEAARALKFPVTTLAALEAEQFERIGHGVYLRGYLSKYLQLLDLPQILCERVVQDHSAPPPLTMSGTISRPRYLFERYSGSALYLILTGVIVVPAALLALRAGFDQNLAQITPLDAPAAVSAPAPETISRNPAPAIAAESPESEVPLTASMTPFPATSANKPMAPPLAVASDAVNRVRLTLAQASWVEIVDADGRKLEYSLLPAGSEREYSSDVALDIRIGNAEGATLSIDGKPQDLAEYRRANVAHLKVADGAASPGHNAG